MLSWQELRDRRLVQIVVAYLAAGWVALTVVDHFVGRAILPELAYRLTLVLYLSGLPAAVVVGWYHGEKGVQEVPRTEIALLLIVAVGALTAGGFVLERHLSERPPGIGAGAGAPGDRPTLAVLYFADRSRGGELRSLADSLTEELVRRLRGGEHVDVLRPEAVRPYRGAEVPADSVARALEAGTVIAGAVERDGRRVRVTARLIDGMSGARIGEGAFSSPRDDFATMADSLAATIARHLHGWLGEEVELGT